MDVFFVQLGHVDFTLASCIIMSACYVFAHYLYFFLVMKSAVPDLVRLASGGLVVLL